MPANAKWFLHKEMQKERQRRPNWNPTVTTATMTSD